MSSKPRLNEQFVVLIEDEDGGIEIDGVRYVATTMALSNPVDATEEMLVRTIEIAARGQKNDGRRRLLVRFKKKELAESGVKLVSVVPIGPVGAILSGLRAGNPEKDSLLPGMTPAQCAVLEESIVPGAVGGIT